MAPCKFGSSGGGKEDSARNALRDVIARQPANQAARLAVAYSAAAESSIG